MPDTFTPEQIAKILEAFFATVGTRQYIGARYVPIFGRKDEESIIWDNSSPYEPLTIVLYQGNSYTSRQYVPAGVEITNQEFWALTGNYNAQIEQYRQETARALQVAEGAQGDIDALLPKSAFSENATVKDYIDSNKTRVIPFANVADMQAATYLVSGMVCHTNGFYAEGDKGESYYYVTDHADLANVDVIELANDLFAVLIIPNDFVSIRQYGVHGDTLHDDTELIQDVLKKVAQDGGATVYFPAGTYNLNNCVYIGDNTNIVGDGAATYFYGTTTSGNHMGVYLAVAGSNVTIDNIGGSYVNGSIPFNSEAANIGLIGIGAYSLESGIIYNSSGNVNDLVRESHEYVTVKNLFCPNCTYPLQTEAPNPDGITDAHIHYVTYDNIQAPHGAVSITNRADNLIDYVTIKNVTCAFLRVANGWKNHVSVSDCKCQMLWCPEIGATINNVSIDYDQNCDIARWIAAGTFTRYRLLYANAAVVSNVIIICDNSDMELIHCEGDTRTLFENVKASGGNGASRRPMYVTQALTDMYTRFSNCDFSGVASDGERKPLMGGLYSNCLLPASIDTSSSQIFADNVKRPVVATFASGVQNASNTYSLAKMSYATDTEVHIRARLVGTAGANSPIFTLGSAYAPVSDSYMIGLYQSSAGDIIGHAFIKIDTDGLATIEAGMSSTTVGALILDGTFMRKPVCYDPYAA